MALRDIVKIGSRVLGTTAGFLIGGPPGAMAGYGVGATVGDIAAGPPEEKMVQTAEIGAYDPYSGFRTDLKSRVSKSDALVSQPGWSDKVTAVADPMVAAASSLYGSMGDGDKTGEMNKKWRKDMGSMTKKMKLTGGVQSQDLSDISTVLDETNELAGTGSRMIENINQRRVSAGLMPLSATQGSIMNIGSAIDMGNVADDVSGAYQKAITTRSSQLPTLSATQSGQVLQENQIGGDIPYLGLYPSLKRRYL